MPVRFEQVYSFRQARAGAAPTPSPGIVAHAAKMLRRIAGEDGEGEQAAAAAALGVEESKGGGGRGGGGGGGGVVSSAQLLDAVNDILGRADLSLSTEQGARLKEGLRLKGEEGQGEWTPSPMLHLRSLEIGACSLWMHGGAFFLFPHIFFDVLFSSYCWEDLV